MALIRTLTISATTFERMKEKFYRCRQTEELTFVLRSVLLAAGLVKYLSSLWVNRGGGGGGGGQCNNNLL